MLVELLVEDWMSLDVKESSREGSGQSLWEREHFLESLDAYKRGLSDAPLLRKWAGKEVKGDGDSAKEMTFVISTDEVDRHGDVIVADGWRLESYQRNPVFLWAHDYMRPVIGKAVVVWQELHGLLARMEFAPTEFAQEVASLYRGNYQRGVSVGFKPIQYEERRHDKTGAFQGIRFLEQELLEVSAVPVPANRSALRRSVDEAHLDAALPELEARIDDLNKLVGELSEMLSGLRVGRSQAEGAGEIAEMLSALRGARW
ncbi:MAG: hypothetical protein BZY73_00170 [SAR202 cluster bacterium Casp-Chloro-G3]|nr:MAG: hypothetical protein BZY73_00170 [SAR202 cluster bacterium Casp-Chloro-G3]